MALHSAAIQTKRKRVNKTDAQQGEEGEKKKKWSTRLEMKCKRVNVGREAFVCCLMMRYTSVLVEHQHTILQHMIARSCQDAASIAYLKF